MCDSVTALTLLARTKGERDRGRVLGDTHLHTAREERHGRKGAARGRVVALIVVRSDP